MYTYYLYADCNKLCVQQKLLIYLFVFFAFIATNKYTFIYHNSIFSYNIHLYMFRHFYVIIREFYFTALPSYINS